MSLKDATNRAQPFPDDSSGVVRPLDAEQVNDYFDSHARAYGRSEFMDRLRAAALRGLLHDCSR